MMFSKYTCADCSTVIASSSSEPALIKERVSSNNVVEQGLDDSTMLLMNKSESMMASRGDLFRQQEYLYKSTDDQLSSSLQYFDK